VCVCVCEELNKQWQINNGITIDFFYSFGRPKHFGWLLLVWPIYPLLEIEKDIKAQWEVLEKNDEGLHLPDELTDEENNPNTLKSVSPSQEERNTGKYK